MNRITLVKKIKLDGTPCRKCLEVTEHLQREGLMERIDAVVLADERDPASEGMRLAIRHGVSRAPFFIVREERVYDSFLRFKREVLTARLSPAEAARELVERYPALDFI